MSKNFNKLEAKSSSLSYYLKSVKQIKQLSYDETTELFIDYKNGSKHAKKKLIESNLRLVVATALKFQHSGLPLEDLIQEGNIGLMRAVEKYKLEKGTRFSTYAMCWIKQAIGQLIFNKKRIIRYPIHATFLQKKINEVSEEYRKINGSEPSTEELSELTEASEQLVLATQQSRSIISVNEKCYAAGTDENRPQTIEDCLVDESYYGNPDNIIAEKDISKVLKKAVASLTPKEFMILRLRYGITEDPTDHEQFPITKDELNKIQKRTKEKTVEKQ